MMKGERSESEPFALLYLIEVPKSRARKCVDRVSFSVEREASASETKRRAGQAAAPTGCGGNANLLLDSMTISSSLVSTTT